VAQLSQLEPLAGVSPPLLPGYFRLERCRLGGIGGYAGNSFAPETQINSGFLVEVCRKRRVELPGSETQLEQWIGGIGFDLGCQHPPSRAPRLTHAAARLDHKHPAPVHGELPGAGGSDGASANHDYVMAGRHSILLKLFETLRRTAA
jgi:hypothetical protein